MSIRLQIMRRLNNVGATTSVELAHELDQERKYVTAALKRLEAEGFVRAIGTRQGRVGRPSVIYKAARPVADLPAERPSRNHGTPMSIRPEMAAEPSTPPTPARKSGDALREVSREIGRQEWIKRQERRDFEARRKDRTRESLARDLAAFLAHGGEIEEVPGYRPAPAGSPAFAVTRRF